MRKNIPSLNLSAFALSASKHVRVFAFTVATILSGNTLAQSVLLRDINTTEETALNEYSNFVRAGTRMYFVVNGTELWKSTGTSGTTLRVKSFNSISNLTLVGGTLYFTADDGTSGVELWKSNGSTAGTMLVKDIRIGRQASQPSWLTNLGSTLYFSANDGQNGAELWKTDGTAAGTVMVKDIRPGAYLSSGPQYLTNVKGVLYFAAMNAAGRELWKSDGTSDGTVMVKDINSNSSLPEQLTNVNGTLFFSAIDNSSGRELWKSNGTDAGTVRVKDIRAGSSGAGIENLIGVNNILYFTADNGVNGDELWKSNGTETGTVLVNDMNPGRAGSNNTDPLAPHGMGNFTNINGLLYFTASIGANDYIYRSDGTAPGTVIIQPIATANSTTSNPGIMYPEPALTFMDGFVYYFNSVDGPDAGQPDGGAWYHLWKMPFDDTVPEMVRTFYRAYDQPDRFSGYNQEMIMFNNSLLMSGRLAETGGFEFIRSDGTHEGTVPVKDVFAPTNGSNVREMIAADNIVYMLEGITPSKSLYRTDGTPAGTYLLRSDVVKITKAGNTLFFVAVDAGNYQLWKTQGTEATTVQIKTLDGLPEELTDLNGTLYFYTGQGRLWKSDGTTAGTFQVANRSEITKIYPSGGRLFIVSDRASAGLDLWKYEGSTMTYVKRIRSTGGNTAIPEVNPYATLGNIFYFVANDGVTGNELWRSDGTSAGTYRLIDLNNNDHAPGNIEPGIEALQVFRNRLYISAVRPTYSGLFYSEGTSALTLVAREHVTQMAANSTELFFWFEESDGDFSFRASPGDYQNAYIVRFVFGGRQPIDYAIINETLFFGGERSPYINRYDSDQQCGALFVTGVNGAYPIEPLGNSMVFVGSTAQTGNEPYVYHDITSVRPCGPPTRMASQDAAEVVEAGLPKTDILTSFPNPFTTDFTMRIDGDDDEVSHVEIFSSDGLSIAKFTDVKSNTDYPSMGQGWRPGIYVAKIIRRSGVTTRMIVKK